MSFLFAEGSEPRTEVQTEVFTRQSYTFRYRSNITGEPQLMKSEIPLANQVSPASNLISDVLAMIFTHLSIRSHSDRWAIRQLLLFRHVSKHWSRLPQVWAPNSKWVCKIKVERDYNPPTSEERQKNAQNLQVYLGHLIESMPYLRRITMDESLSVIEPGDINWKLSLATPICRLQDIEIFSHHSEYLISLIQYLPLLDKLTMKNGRYQTGGPLSFEAENILASLPLRYLSTENIEWTSFFKHFHSSRLASHLTTLVLMDSKRDRERRRDNTNYSRAVALRSQLNLLAQVSLFMKPTVMGINVDEEELDQFQASHSCYLYLDMAPLMDDDDLQWSIIREVISTCTITNHLYTGLTDLTKDCIQSYNLMISRGTASSPSSVNGVKCNESICSTCHEVVSLLQTCEACKVTACGPCLASLPGRIHFLCQGRHDEPSGILYCFAIGPCDDHVLFQCPDCIDHGAGDTSPAECGACGGLACYEHCAYGYCKHYPETMWRCSNCRCFKCQYCCGEFSGDCGGDYSDDIDEDEDANSDMDQVDDGDSGVNDEDDEAATSSSIRKRDVKKKKRSQWHHG